MHPRHEAGALCRTRFAKEWRRTTAAQQWANTAARARARTLVSPPRFCVPGDYDVNYERRSLKVNASGRARVARERTDPRGFW